jgi:MoaA/NifB/PqqE/SkfB family radical SAM enzyme
LFGAMTTEHWCAVIDDAADMGCCRVQFIGGEPLLHPAIEGFARRARDHGMDVEILTNGTVLSAQSLAWMSALKVDVSTSVYSACATGHDAVTRKIGSWHKTLTNIDRMITEGLRVRAGVIYRDWDGDGVNETVTLLEGKGVVVGTDRVRGIGRGGSPDSYEAYLGELCGACGKERACVTNTGDVYPCIMARRTILGNVRRDGLQAILAGTALATFESALARRSNLDAACTPDCWPHGGCAPHDVCNPHKRPAASINGNCTPDCWPHGGCAPHDLCNPHKAVAKRTPHTVEAH